MSKKNKRVEIEDEIKEEKKIEEKDEKSINKKEERIQHAQNHKLFQAILITLTVTLLCIVGLIPILKETKFGLDLQGGFEILYKVSSTDGSKVTKEMMNNTYRTILKRVDILGVSEPEISIEGDNIRIQLAGVTNEQEAKKTLSSMANMTFRNSSDELIMTSKVLKGNGVRVVQDERNIGVYFLSLDIADVDTFHKKTEEIRAAGDVLVIWLDFDEETDSFEKERENCGTNTNSRCISYASIQQELTTSSVTLSGNFTYDEAKSLADLINSGSLPTKLTELSAKTVNASFGSNALQKTFIAGIVAIALIILLLVWIYRFSGLIASAALIMYTMMVFLVFNLIGGRLTLPGIAGAIIGIAMAIDAAVISFARIKEELRDKYPLREAYKRGNEFSFTSILDANVTSVIVAFILFYFGESSVKGFATMLIVSIIASMIVMVYALRTLLGMFVNSGKFDKKHLAFLGIKDLNKKSFIEKFNFGKHMLKLTVITFIMLAVGTVYLFKNGFNLGIEFKGGSSISITAKEQLNIKAIQKDMEELGYTVEKIESLDKNSAYLTLNDVFTASDNEKVESYFNENYTNATTSIGAISNTVKKQLVDNAIYALIFAFLGLILYVSLRFTFSFGVSGVIAIVHDVMVIAIVFSLLKFEVTSIFIAAILSIIAYSINDTIVVFDRIRENKKKLFNGKVKTKEELKELVNTSMQETVMRNIITSASTIIPVIALLVLGSYEIANFNYALLIGFIAGCYSTIILTIYFYYLFESFRVGKPDKKKWYEVETSEKEELKVKGVNC